MSLISKTGIVTGQVIQAEHVTRIIDSLNESGSFSVIATGSFTGSFAGDGSQLTGIVTDSASYAANANLLNGYSSSYFATTGSNTFTGTQTINGNVNINGTASIAFLNVTYESASVIYSSGSNQFGDAVTDTQTLIGTVIVSGSLNVTGSANIPSITGSLLGTSSFAVSASVAQNAISASYAPNSVTASFAATASFITASGVYGPFGASSITSASYAVSASYVIGGVDPFPYTGSAEITGSLGVTGSVNVTRLGVGAIGSSTVPLDVRAQGALSTDTAFRVRNSTDTANLFSVSGDGTFSFDTQNGYPAFQIYSNFVNRTYMFGTNVLIGGGLSTNRLSFAPLEGFAGTFYHYGLNSFGETGLSDVYTSFQLRDQFTTYFYARNGRNLYLSTNPNTSAKSWSKTFWIETGSAPTENLASHVAIYSATSSAGTASIHFRNEAGHVVKLYTQGPVSSSQGIADVLTNLGLLSGSSVVIDVSGSGTAFPYTGSAGITGSLNVVGPITYGPETQTLHTTANAIVTTAGSYTLYSLPTGSYDSLHIEYTAKSGSNARAGYIVTVWNQANASYSEVSTTDIGDTTAMQLTTLISGNTILFTGSFATDNWTVKSIIRAI